MNKSSNIASESWMFTKNELKQDRYIVEMREKKDEGLKVGT